MVQNPQNAGRKPGMDPTARKCVGRWFGYLLCLVGCGLLYGAIIGTIYLFSHHHSAFMRLYCAGVFACIARMFFGMAKDRKKYGHGTRVLCWLGSMFAAFTAINAAAVLG